MCLNHPETICPTCPGLWKNSFMKPLVPGAKRLSCPRPQALPKDPGQGCSSVWREPSSPGSRAAGRLSLQLVVWKQRLYTACAAILKCQLPGFRTGSAEVTCQRSHVTPRILASSAECEASAHSTFWARETQSMGENVRLYYPLFYFYFLGIVSELEPWQSYAANREWGGMKSRKKKILSVSWVLGGVAR